MVRLHQAIGRSRGGPTTKIHALTDGCGRAVAFLLTPGNIADKEYGANSLRGALGAQGTEAVIPFHRVAQARHPP